VDGQLRRLHIEVGDLTDVRSLTARFREFVRLGGCDDSFDNLMRFASVAIDCRESRTLKNPAAAFASRVRKWQKWSARFSAATDEKARLWLKELDDHE